MLESLVNAIPSRQTMHLDDLQSPHTRAGVPSLNRADRQMCCAERTWHRYSKNSSNPANITSGGGTRPWTWILFQNFQLYVSLGVSSWPLKSKRVSPMWGWNSWSGEKRIEPSSLAK